MKNASKWIFLAAGITLNFCGAFGKCFPLYRRLYDELYDVICALSQIHHSRYLSLSVTWKAFADVSAFHSPAS